MTGRNKIGNLNNLPQERKISNELVPSYHPSVRKTSDSGDGGAGPPFRLAECLEMEYSHNVSNFLTAASIGCGTTSVAGPSLPSNRLRRAGS